MRHRISGKQLSRTTSHRRAMRRNMAASLIQHGAIRTTDVKAKELRPFIERLITIARKGTLAARRQVISLLQDRAMTDNEGEFLDQTVVQKLFSEVAPRYADRPGGYTRIIRLAERRIGDAGKQVLLQLVEEQSAEEKTDTDAGASRRKRRAAKRHEAVAAAGAEATEPAAEETPADEPTGEEVAPKEASTEDAAAEEAADESEEK